MTDTCNERVLGGSRCYIEAYCGIGARTGDDTRYGCFTIRYRMRNIVQLSRDMLLNSLRIVLACY